MDPIVRGHCRVVGLAIPRHRTHHVTDAVGDRPSTLGTRNTRLEHRVNVVGTPPFDISKREPRHRSPLGWAPSLQMYRRVEGAYFTKFCSVTGNVACAARRFAWVERPGNVGAARR